MTYSCIVEQNRNWNHCQLDPREQTSIKFAPKYNGFRARRRIWNVVCKIATILFRLQCGIPETATKITYLLCKKGTQFSSEIGYLKIGIGWLHNNDHRDGIPHYDSILVLFILYIHVWKLTCWTCASHMRSMQGYWARRIWPPFHKIHITWDQTLYILTLNDMWVIPSIHVIS